MTEKELVELESELIPKDPLFRKKPRKPRKIKGTREANVVSRSSTTNIIDPSNGIKAPTFVYGGTPTPFKDSRTFTDYYRSFLRSVVLNVSFESYESDVQSAGLILDSLREKGRKDKKFLDAWIMYYVEISLKGKKGSNPKHTAMKSFGKTLKKYDEIFHASF